MRVQITFDDKAWQPFLAAWQEPAVKKTLGAAASAWGRRASVILKIFTPVAPPGNNYAKPPNGPGAGNLKSLTKSRRMNRRYGIGVVVGPMGKGAYYRRFVVGGTKPHLILPKAKGSRGHAARALALAGGYARVVHHPGARANNYVARAFPLAEKAGHLAAQGVVFDGLQARRIAEGLDDL